MQGLFFASLCLIQSSLGLLRVSRSFCALFDPFEAYVRNRINLIQKLDLLECLFLNLVNSEARGLQVFFHLLPCQIIDALAHSLLCMNMKLQHMACSEDKDPYSRCPLCSLVQSTRDKLAFPHKLPLAPLWRWPARTSSASPWTCTDSLGERSDRRMLPPR